MQGSFRRVATGLCVALALALRVAAADLSETDKQFLAGYEKIRAALVADDLGAAKAAAAEIGDKGASVARSESIAAARKEFAPLSEEAVKLAKGQSGYYVAYCPMVKKSWVQTSEKISNPYAGGEMLTCGVIKK